MGLRGLDSILIPGTVDRIDYDRPEDVRAFFREFESKNIATVADAGAFVGFLSKFRQHVEKYTSLNGANFLNTVRNIFSVGDDGLYSNRMRFLFELIQNVDDCEYAPGEHPKLTITFDADSRKLILRYNEIGFTPRNVFSITGIAEDDKNTTIDKIQIGEKGIGFKSVFGVANSVLIRSGLFSFRLNRDHFTIPIPEYSDGFAGVRGTELTLEFDSDVTLVNVKDALMECYRKDNALFTQNPILFLNKLNGLEFKSGDESLLSFSISRPPVEKVAGKPLAMCRGMTMMLHRKGRPDCSISGTCYATSVSYSMEDCQSRYGTDTCLGRREMKIEAFFPDPSYVIGETGRGSIEHGLLYSFLPTQVELEVPIICHAPFKLDASREYVDSQSKNLWFRRTMTALSAFIHSCYRLQAIDVHENIVAYIPKYSKNFFAYKNNLKMDDLLRPEYGLGGDAIGRDKIFYCKDGEFRSVSEVESFAKCEEVEQPLELLRLCRNTRPFFCSPPGFTPGEYNMHCIDDPYALLFSTVFSDMDAGINDVRSAITIVKRKKPSLIQEACREGDFDALNANHLVALSEVGELQLLVDTLVQRVRRSRSADFIFHRTDGYMRDVFELIDDESAIGYDDMGARSASYFKDINGYCWVLNKVGGDGFCIPADNVCVVAGGDCSSGLIDLCQKLDPDSLFSVRLKLKKASAALDVAMTTDNPRDFLSQLRNIRIASKDAMGERAYKSYLDLIQKSGTATGRYVNELLQNADDCEYPEGVIPTVEISSGDGKLIFTTNEVGFKANNVRAITAIGESTKNLLLNAGNNRLAIGEKGVGFKSVFAIADSVEVHSGGFDFVLNAAEPTIPCLIPESPDHAGTIMRLTLKDGYSVPLINEQDVLELCVCLRNLRTIKLLGYDVMIEDDGAFCRRVTINGVAHEFLVYEHRFTIDDERALEVRNSGGKRYSADQIVRCYVPTEISRYEYPLYSGLPLRSKTCAPIIVDAPFELTTARDAVLEESRWNGHVLGNVYAGIIKTADFIKDQLRINVLHFFGIESAEMRSGSLRYKAKMFKGVGETFLNTNENFIDSVREAEIIPVESSPDVFLCPKDTRLRMFPKFLSRMYEEEAGRSCPFERVDFTGGQEVDHLRNVLEALTVRSLDESELWNVVENLGDLSELMRVEAFRAGLYTFLRRLKNVELASCHPIVPVIMENDTKFVSEDEGLFFFSNERRVSTEKYFIVDTEMLDRKAYADIFSDELREMNDAQEREFYCGRVCKYLMEHSVGDRYQFILRELQGVNSENLQLCMPIIRHRCRNMIPLKNLNGEIVCRKMFLDDCNGNVIRGQMLGAIVIDPECSSLAGLLECQQMSAVNYRDLPMTPWEMSREDVLDIKDGNILDKEDVLLLAVKNGRISEDLATEFGLTTGLTSDPGQEFVFPTEPLRNLQVLRAHILEFLNNPIRIVSKQVLRAVDYCVPTNGKEFELSSKEARRSVLQRYSPDGRTDVCFCQMCQRAKRVCFVEVNCIERKPKLYFPQLRLALCLECSKKFELLRNSTQFCEDFISKLQRMTVLNFEDNVRLRMPIQGNQVFELTFTRVHLAEVQEILKGRAELEIANRFR